jgi:hypothetical protein
MDQDALLAEVDRGSPRHDVVVFRFRKGRALLIATLLALIGIFVIGAAAAMAPHVNPNAGNVRYGVAVVAGLMALSALWQAWRKVTEVRYATTNVIVVCREGVVRRLRGRVQAFPFADFPVITFVLYNWHRNTPRKAVNVDVRAGAIDDHIVQTNFYAGQVTVIYLSEADATFQNELVDDGSFGPMHEIVRAILTRGTTRSGGPGNQARPEM